MDYNTNRKKLELPEYGRNVQNMVGIIKNTADREERNKLAKSTIQLMENMNPQLRDVADYKHKLWDHLAVIADFDLDIDSPYPLPTQAEIHQKPSKMKYSNPDEIRFKHYGKILEDMVRKATMGSLRRGSQEGDTFRGSVFAGQACGLVHDIAPVVDRVQKFCDEWQAWLKKEYKLF